MASQQDPHFVIALCSIETDEALEYKSTLVHEDGSADPRFDNKEHYVKVLGKYPTRAAAQRIAKGLAEWSPREAMTNPHELGKFDERLPDTPALRAAAYKSLAPDAQAAIVYSIISSTALPIKKVAAWLNVDEEDVREVFSDGEAASARAELDFRIAKKMIQFALQNKSPAAMSACIFLCKAILNWSDQGIGSDDAVGVLKDAKSLFASMEVIETHRDENGVTLAEPTRLTLVSST